MNNKGFVLAETLIVTTFVIGVLLYLFIQFTSLSSSYNENYVYNTVESLYAIEDIKELVVSDSTIVSYIENNIQSSGYIDISSCELFEEQEYCKRLIELENIEKIIVTENEVNKSLITEEDSGFLKFINRINKEGNQNYRLIAKFKNGTYSTIRFN